MRIADEAVLRVIPQYDLFAVHLECTGRVDSGDVTRDGNSPRLLRNRRAAEEAAQENNVEVAQRDRAHKNWSNRRHATHLETSRLGRV